MVTLDDARECRLVRPDGRTVAWLDVGDLAGPAVLWVPGTPGARWDLSEVDLHECTERGLRVLSTERPGFGASTRLPGRRFSEHADDLAAVLDASGVATAYVYGLSGAAPHILSFLSRHPDRAQAATILVGAAPLVDAEAEQMIELNRVEWLLMKEGDRAAIEANLRPWWEEELRDPRASILRLLDAGPESDRRVLEDPKYLSNVERATREALSTEENFQAWIDESFALRFGWDDIKLDRHLDVDHLVPRTATPWRRSRPPSGSSTDSPRRGWSRSRTLGTRRSSTSWAQCSTSCCRADRTDSGFDRRHPPPVDPRRRRCTWREAPLWSMLRRGRLHPGPARPRRRRRRGGQLTGAAPRVPVTRCSPQVGSGPVAQGLSPDSHRVWPTLRGQHVTLVAREEPGCAALSIAVLSCWSPRWPG